MNQEQMDWEKIEREAMAEEEKVREKVDEKGNRWKKIYFGSGMHFQNWLDQCLELYGKDNVEVEEVANTGLKCYVEGGEKMCRIWVREGDLIVEA
jgi:hypothetical protein